MLTYLINKAVMIFFFKSKCLPKDIVKQIMEAGVILILIFKHCK